MGDYERGFADGHKCCQHEKDLLTEENANLKRMFAGTQYRAEVLEKENVRMRAVVAAARSASQEIQSQKVSWPGEVDTLMDALAALDRESFGQEPKTIAEYTRIDK